MLRLIHRTFYTSQTIVSKKFILVYLEEKNELSEALARRIQRDLKENYFNAQEIDKIIQSSQVPYTVIINKRTLTDGVLELKHYNPDIKEEVHVSNLIERLLLQTGSVTLRCTKVERHTAKSSTSHHDTCAQKISGTC